MAQFELAQERIKALGQLVFVAAQKRSGVFSPLKFFSDHSSSFPYLLDEDRAVTKAYGVYHRIGVDAYNIARPATFVIGGDGVIRFIHVGAHQSDRASLEELLEALRAAPHKEES
jgi:peroxiredoxin